MACKQRKMFDKREQREKFGTSIDAYYCYDLENNENKRVTEQDEEWWYRYYTAD